MYDLTAFQRDLLFVVAGMDATTEQYGLAIKRAVGAYRGEEIPHARLYTNLDDLVDAGYLTRSELDGRTNEYRVTEDGREMMAARVEWAREQLEVTA